MKIVNTKCTVKTACHAVKGKMARLLGMLHVNSFVSIILALALIVGVIGLNVQNSKKHWGQMTKKELIYSITMQDSMTTIQTMWGEARGEKFFGKIAIVQVGLNRVSRESWYGHNLHDVFLKKEQFSCWNERDPNYKKVVDLTWEDAENYELNSAFKLAINWWVAGEDITRGATHYHADYVTPYWAVGKVPCAVIGGHKYYNDID